MEITDLVYLDSTGWHFADYPSFLSWLQEKYRGIYGADVYLEADSQDGQFVAILARAFYSMAAAGGSITNSFSPASAQGVGLSRVVKINGITRRVPTYSTVDVAIGGTSGTTITGGVAIDTLNQKWDIPTTTIPGGGTITVTATAQEPGAIGALPNTVNRIFTPTRGWQTVNNVGAATPGVSVEIDAELRTRQTVSTANPARTVFDGTVGGVANVSGVTDVRGYENDTGSTDGNGIPGHTIAIIADGGTTTDIANAINLRKGPGCGTFGSTTVVVYDSRGMPSSIKFSRSTVKNVKAEITLDVDAGYASGYDDLISAAVAEAINNFGIGNDVILTKLYVPSTLPSPAGLTYSIVTIQIAFVGDALGDINLPITFNQKPVCDPANVVIVR